MSTETTVSLDGVDIFVVSQGTGVPIFVIGGPWFGHTYLRQFHDQLATRFHVIAFDPRGSGRSSPLTEDRINLEGHLTDLEGLRRALNVERMNLVGHSMGALVSLLYAVDHPSEMGSLVLLHPGPPFDHQMQKDLHRAFGAGFTPEERTRLEQLASSSLFEARDASTLEEYFKVLYSPFFPDRSTLARLDFAFTSTTALYAMDAEERLLPEILARDPIARLGEIRCPTLVIHAEHDLIPEAFSRFLAQSIPGAEYLLLEGLGHFAFLENPARFVPPNIEFLKRAAI
jgi:proline iminopeptidase